MRRRLLKFICWALALVTVLCVLWTAIRHEFPFGIPWLQPEWEGDLSIPSPDGRYVAVVLRGDVSAITDFSYRLYIFPHDVAPKVPGKKATVSLTGKWNDKRYLVYAGDAIPMFRWTSDHEVEIDLDDLYDEIDEFHPVPALETPPKDSRSAVLVSLILNKKDDRNAMP